MPLFSHGQKLCLFIIWRCANKYMTLSPFTRAFCTVSVCRTGQDSRSARFFRSVSVLEENSRQSLLIVPLEIFSFPPQCQIREKALAFINGNCSLQFNRNKVTWCCHHSSHHQPLLRKSCMDFLPSWSYDIHLPDVPLHEESFQWKQAVWLRSSLVKSDRILPQFWAQADVQSGGCFLAFSFHDGRALAALRVFFQCVHDCWIFFDGFLIVMTEWRNFS